MQIDRDIGLAPRTSELGVVVAGLHGDCIGCAACRGLCAALIDLLTVPGSVLKENAARPGR